MSDDYGLNAEISADDSGFQAAFDRMEQSLGSWGLSLDKMYEEGAGVFKKFGVDVDAFAEKLGVSGELLSGFVAVGLAAAELGKQILEIGAEFDEASAVIERTTGANSTALAAMNADFETLMGSGVSQNIDDVAAGFSLLSVRLGVSGESLDALTKKFTEYAEVAGISVKDAVSSVTDVMNKWNIPAAQAPELLDQLTKASQLSGVSVATFAENLKSGGAQFQELGLSLTSATALLAAFGKDGVNTSTVLTGLRTAVKGYAKEGVDAGTALQKTFDQIKDARSPTEALTASIAAFGARAGPEMANAIMTGKASIEDFKAAIAGAGGTVEETAHRSQTLGEAWAATMNQVKAAVAPLGDLLVSIAKMVVQVISDIVAAIQNIVGPVFTELKTRFADFEAMFDTFFDAIGRLIHGDWKGAWTDAQIIVLEMVKQVSDGLSMLLGVFIGLINDMINVADKVLDRVKLHIEDIKTVALSTTLGITQAIAQLQESLGETKKTAIDLGAKSPSSGTSSSGAMGPELNTSGFNVAEIANAYGRNAQVPAQAPLETGPAVDYLARIAKITEDDAEYRKEHQSTLSLSDIQLSQLFTDMHKKLFGAYDQKTGAIKGGTEAGVVSSGASAGAATGDPLGALMGGLQAFEGVLTGGISSFLGLVTSVQSLQEVLNPIQTIIQEMMQVLTPVINAVLDPLVSALQLVGQDIADAIIPVLDDLAPILSMVAPLIKVMGENIAIFINSALLPLELALEVLGPVFTLIGDVFQGVATMVAAIWNGIANGLDSISVWPFGQLFHIPTIGGSMPSSSGTQAAISVGGVTVSGYASGTDYASAGAHLVGEQGPELAYLSQGTKVMPAAATARAVGKSTTINANFYSPTPIDATTATRQLRALQRQLAFQGSL